MKQRTDRLVTDPEFRRAERQSARMSKITNDDLTRSGTEYFTAVTIWQHWASKS